MIWIFQNFEIIVLVLKKKRKFISKENKWKISIRLYVDSLIHFHEIHRRRTRWSSNTRDRKVEKLSVAVLFAVSFLSARRTGKSSWESGNTGEAENKRRIKRGIREGTWWTAGIRCGSSQVYTRLFSILGGGIRVENHRTRPCIRVRRPFLPG